MDGPRERKEGRKKAGEKGRGKGKAGKENDKFLINTGIYEYLKILLLHIISLQKILNRLSLLKNVNTWLISVLWAG
jgi:hypothetical protein